MSVAGHSDAEDITAKHSNFKTVFRNKTKTPQLFGTIVVTDSPVIPCLLRGLLFFFCEYDDFQVIM